ncbi:MAG: 16S rRNA (cytidine(1402)-2'-O)-methyltransferase [Acidobacteriia bacterium]|nr:16S rRNA (cytidine(1402)-2'-O)-methyltransferase [Terriglobia bacterium]
MGESRIGTSTLFLVATPIGNLEDISLRALRVLKEVDLVACEDTRHTARLLNHYGIKTPCESHHEHNEAGHTRRLLALLQEGKNVALVSDAGTPLLSDPGYTLVTACRKAGLSVIPIPGPSAIVAALTGSGLPTDSFFFAGFLPPRRGPRRKRLQEIADIPATLVFYEAPHRLEAALEDMVGILGARQACLARELTKIHEEWLQGTLPEILTALRTRPQIRGEITLIVDRGASVPPPAQASWPASIAEHLQEEMQKTGASRKDALKSIARQRGISRKDAYRQLLLARKSLKP